MKLEVGFALLVGLNLGLVFLNVPAAMTQLMALYGSSYTEMSVLLSGLLWTHAAMQLPAGIIVDRLGVRGTQLLSLSCMGVGNLLPALIPSVGFALCGRMLAGVGTGMAWLVNLTMLALSTPGARGGAYQAYFGGFFSIGSILAYMFIPRIVEAGWRWVFLTPAFICVLLLALVPFLRVPGRPSARRSLPFGRILRIREGWILGSYHAVSYGAMIGLANWIPSLLAEVFADRTAKDLVWGGVLVMLVSGLARLTGGVIIVRVSSLAIAHGSVAVLCVIFAGLTLVPTPATVLALALLAAGFGSLNFGALFYLASRAVTAESLGSVFGLVNFLGNPGAVIFTFLLGWSKDSLGSFSWGFALLAALSALALGIGLFATASRSRGPSTVAESWERKTVAPR